MTICGWSGSRLTDDKLARDFTALDVDLVYLPYTLSTSNNALRRALKCIDAMAENPTRADGHEVAV